MWQYIERNTSTMVQMHEDNIFQQKMLFSNLLFANGILHVVLLWNLSGNWNVNKCQLLSAVVWSKMTTSLMLDWELRWKLKWYWSEIWGEIEIKNFFRVTLKLQLKWQPKWQLRWQLKWILWTSKNYTNGNFWKKR